MIVRGSSNMSSEISIPVSIPGNISDASGEQSTLVTKEIKFLQENLSEERVDNDYVYGFWEGSEERKEEFLEQFTALNSTCFVRSKTDPKTEAKGSSLHRSQGNISPEACVETVYFISFIVVLVTLCVVGRKRLRRDVPPKLSMPKTVQERSFSPPLPSCVERQKIAMLALKSFGRMPFIECGQRKFSCLFINFEWQIP